MLQWCDSPHEFCDAERRLQMASDPISEYLFLKIFLRGHADPPSRECATKETPLANPRYAPVIPIIISSLHITSTYPKYKANFKGATTAKGHTCNTETLDNNTDT